MKIHSNIDCKLTEHHLKCNMSEGWRFNIYLIAKTSVEPARLGRKGNSFLCVHKIQVVCIELASQHVSRIGGKDVYIGMFGIKC